LRNVPGINPVLLTLLILIESKSSMLPEEETIA
jgi:hypothetical protein